MVKSTPPAIKFVNCFIGSIILGISRSLNNFFSLPLSRCWFWFCFPLSVFRSGTRRVGVSFPSGWTLFHLPQQFYRMKYPDGRIDLTETWSKKAQLHRFHLDIQLDLCGTTTDRICADNRSTNRPDLLDLVFGPFRSSPFLPPFRASCSR